MFVSFEVQWAIELSTWAAFQEWHNSEKITFVLGLKMFGGTYSGLEYDYRGLIHVYHELDDVEKVADYTYILNSWKLHRDLHAQQQNPPIDQEEAPQAMEDITRQFFDGEKWLCATSCRNSDKSLQRMSSSGAFGSQYAFIYDILEDDWHENSKHLSVFPTFYLLTRSEKVCFAQVPN